MSLSTNFLSRGYFPSELPPCFSSSYFGSLSDSLQELPSSKTSKCCRHNLARTGSLRRKLSVPNPIHYKILVGVLVSATQDLDACYKKSLISRSKPTPDKTSRSAVIPSHGFDEIYEEIASIRSTARFVAITDISKFYASVYTHSIPWALHGKQKAKANRSTKLIGNRIDAAVRNCQDGQTIGIPIGPDSSFVIAEAILSEIDECITAVFDPHRICRRVDDYQFAGRTQEECESFLSILQTHLAEYELELNPRKTKIVPLPNPIEEEWVRLLKNYTIKARPKSQWGQLKGYFDLVADLHSKWPGSAVAKYAIAKLNFLEINESNWPSYQRMLAQMTMVEPSVLQYAVSHLLVYIVEKGRAIDERLWGEVISDLICFHSLRGHGSEVAWSLWTAMALDLTVNAEAVGALRYLEDPFVSLLAIDADDAGRFESSLDTQRYKAWMNQDELYGEQWILVYEAARRNWLSSTSNIFDDAFKELDDRGIEFYTQVDRSYYPDPPLDAIRGRLEASSKFFY